jgi:hypothetical protein
MVTLLADLNTIRAYLAIYRPDVLNTLQESTNYTYYVLSNIYMKLSDC